MTAAELEDMEERAAILEFDAGMTRRDAERIARQMVEAASRLPFRNDLDKTFRYNASSADESDTGAPSLLRAAVLDAGDARPMRGAYEGAGSDQGDA